MFHSAKVRQSGGVAVVQAPAARARILLAIGVSSLVFSVLFAGPVIKLTDGREMRGVDLRRDGDLFILVLANGSSIPIPSAAIKVLEWTEGDYGAGSAPARPANIVRGRTDAEAQADEERRERRDQENEAWVEQRRAEMEQDKLREEEEDRRDWIESNWGYIQPSGYVGPGWQGNVAGSTLQPSYWVPDPGQDIGNRP